MVTDQEQNIQKIIVVQGAGKSTAGVMILSLSLMLASAPALSEDWAVSAGVGTLGIGVGVAKAFSDSVVGRFGVNAYDYTFNTSRNTVNYDLKLQLQSLSALADWHPWQGTFRTSAGLLYNNNKAVLNAKPSAGSYILNDITYNAADVGSLQGSMSFNKVAPYLGIGWGNPVAKDKTWGFTADIGVLLQGSPKAGLNVTCGTTITTAGQTCATLQTAVAGERAKLESKLSSFRWYPVASVGLSYKW